MKTGLPPEKDASLIKVCRSELDELIHKNGNEPKDLIIVLQAVQNRFNYLPEAALTRISEILGCSMATIMGVATFYKQFRLNPAGKHTIRVCVGTACHVKGATQVYDTIRDKLNLKEDADTDEEKQFTVEKVSCIGCCMLAPALQIDEITYGPVQPMKAGAVIDDFLKEQDVADANNTSVKTASESLELAGEVRICRCSSCSAAGANSIYQTLQQLIEEYAYPIRLKTVGCTGSSWEAPLLEVITAKGDSFRYTKVRRQDVSNILRRHFRPVSIFRQGKALLSSTLEQIMFHQNRSGDSADSRDSDDASIRFFGPQKAIATQHQGEHDPLDLGEYKKHGGFAAYSRCLEMKNPWDIIQLIKESGLRGRGGGGFPTAKKWEMLAASRENVKYLVCNGDEGDPGAFMDRMILESFPFRVIEGMAIAALAVGAKQAFAYVRSEYSLATKRFKEALDCCIKSRILADAVDDTGDLLNIKLVEGAGAFVCGEETALIESIEGKRGIPRLRPPYPVERGLWGQPTVVNNVETFACIPWIIRNGATAFSSYGTSSSKGTKTFALAGKVRRSGLIEVPMGVSIRQIIEDIGGGIPGNKKLKAVQIGGPSGGCIPASMCDLKIDYEALQAFGAIMGSGGLIVLDEDDCMVDIARYFMEFIQGESCGKCTFCRVGTRRMLEILERLCLGEGKAGDIEALESLGHDIQKNSLCGLGRTAPNPVLSTLMHFREEYEAHVNGHCPAGKCKELIQYKITEKCIGCTICVQNCPTGAIPFMPLQVHHIDAGLCTKCDVCRQVCPTQGAIIVE
jgi:NADH:ubiquinone oxidoreductase subunit F (NADH-binding)/NADH:ubiquinone oxidoreductase subunit E/Pyruvate/2-oxoacid:ferredoxin oxidoreductase delta subunit